MSNNNCKKNKDNKNNNTSNNSYYRLTSCLPTKVKRKMRIWEKVPNNSKRNDNNNYDYPLPLVYRRSLKTNWLEKPWLGMEQGEHVFLRTTRTWRRPFFSRMAQEVFGWRSSCTYVRTKTAGKQAGRQADSSVSSYGPLAVRQSGEKTGEPHKKERQDRRTYYSYVHALKLTWPA